MQATEWQSMFVSHKGYLFMAKVMPRVSEQVLVHLDSAEKKAEFDTADLRKEIAGFNICRGEQTLSLQC